MLYAIYAYDQMYGGMHGMNDYNIIDVKDEKAAKDCALEMSLDIIASYDCIYNDLEGESCGDEDLLDELTMQDTGYEVKVVKEEYQDKNINTLIDIMDDDIDGFLDEYCDDI